MNYFQGGIRSEWTRAVFFVIFPMDFQGFPERLRSLLLSAPRTTAESSKELSALISCFHAIFPEFRVETGNIESSPRPVPTHLARWQRLWIVLRMDEWINKKWKVSVSCF